MENWFAGFAERHPVFPGLMEAAIESVGAGLCPRPLSWGQWIFCRGRPVCRPGHGSSRDPSTGGHIGPPLRGAKGIREPTEIGVKGRATGRDGARPLQGTGAGLRRRGAPGVWLPPAKFRNGIWGVSHGHRPLRPAGGRGTARRVVVPYGWLRRAAAIPLGSGAEWSVCAADRRNGWELEQRSPQKGPATPDNPSVSLRLTAPFTQGSLWGREMRIAASARWASSQ